MQILWQIQQPAAITLLLILLGLTFPVRGLLFLIVGCTRGIRPSRTTVILCVVEVKFSGCHHNIVACLDGFDAATCSTPRHNGGVRCQTTFKDFIPTDNVTAF